MAGGAVVLTAHHTLPTAHYLLWQAVPWRDVLGSISHPEVGTEAVRHEALRIAQAYAYVYMHICICIYTCLQSGTRPCASPRHPYDICVCFTCLPCVCHQPSTYIHTYTHMCIRTPSGTLPSVLKHTHTHTHIYIYTCICAGQVGPGPTRGRAAAAAGAAAPRERRRAGA